MKFLSVKKIISNIKDYCSNCTLAGLKYAANSNLHLIERIFWLVCFLSSSYGSYYLMNQFQHDFDEKAVSIVYESVQPDDKVMFPSVAVCSLYSSKALSEEIIAFVDKLSTLANSSYSFELETHVLFLVYPYLYHDKVIQVRCRKMDRCAKCAKCIKDGSERKVFKKYSVKCQDFLVECVLADKPFNCCHYFQPLLTPWGRCFLLNSLQNNKPGSPTWLNMLLDPLTQRIYLKLVANSSMHVVIHNPEDVPHLFMPGVSAALTAEGQYKTLKIFQQRMTNDVDVRDVSPEHRQCRFPDETLPNTVYKAYSFSACFIDCIRSYQKRYCNCTLFSMTPEGAEVDSDCDLEGMYCLEKENFVKPDAKTLLPWANISRACSCYPSCTENEINTIYDSQSSFEKSKQRKLIIDMSKFSAESYRRQALRSKIDVVVTIGGILGLFLGASILSGIEFFYHFSLRMIDDAYVLRRKN